MLIFFDRRLVFLATPKAGSTAIEAALDSLANLAIARPEPLKHTTLAEFEHHIRPWLEAKTGGERFTTVALMREPLDWVRSWYRFRRRDDGDNPDHPMAGLDFEGFARACIAADPPPFARIGRQVDHLTAPGVRVDRIFRYEDMGLFTDFLEQWLDCIVNLPRLNVPPDAETGISPEGAAALATAFAADHALHASLSPGGSGLNPAATSAR